MTIGLDLGSHRFRSIRSLDHQLIARSCPAVFATLSDTPAHRRLLQQSNTQIVTCSDQLLMFGDEAIEWSSMLNLSLTPLLRGGRIPTSDPVSRQLLSLMIDAVLPAPAGLGTLCCMTMPGGSSDDRIKNHDADFFQQLVALRGYRPQTITATQALALAEFNDSSFTGIAITLGYTTCEFGIVHCGRELARCVVMSGLAGFDESTRLGDPKAAAESTSIERDYSRFFADVVAEARSQFEQNQTLKTLPQPMSVICSGGITGSESFLPLFQRVWDDSRWPIATRPIRVSANADLTVARGCLIQAELDRPRERKSA